MPESDLQIRFGVIDTEKIVNALKSIEEKLGGMAAKTNETAQKTQSSLDKMEAKFVSAGDKIMGKALKWGSVIAAAFGGISLTAMVKWAGEFDTALSEVSTLVDTSVVDINKYREALLKLSKESGEGLRDLTKGLYQALSASIDASKAVEFVGKANKAAVGGLSSTSVAVDVLSTALNSYGLSVEDTTNISDQMFTAVVRGKTTFDELAKTIGAVTPIAANAGIGFDELMAATSTLTRGGLSTERAVTGLRQVIATMVKPSQEATEAARALGIDFSAAGLKANGLQGMMVKLAEATGGNLEKIATLIPSVEALPAALTLAGIGAKGFANDLNAMRNSTGATELAYQKMVQSFEHQTKILKSTVIATFVEMAQSVLPELIKVFENLKSWIDANEESLVAWTKEAVDSIVELIKWIDKYSGSLKLLGELLVSLWVVAKVRTYITAIEVLAATMTTATGATMTLKGAMLDLRTAFTWVIAALAAFAVGWKVGTWWSDITGLTKSMDELGARWGDRKFQEEAEAATLKMLNEKYDKHFKSMHEWNTYLEQKREERKQKEIKAQAEETKAAGKAKTEQLALVKKYLGAEAELNAETFAEAVKRRVEEKKAAAEELKAKIKASKEFADKVALDGLSILEKAKEQYDQDLKNYGMTKEGKAAADKKYEDAKTAYAAQMAAARFANEQERLQKTDQQQAGFIQKQIDRDVATGNIFVNNTDTYLGQIYELENISLEDRQKLVDAALAVQKTKYEAFANELNAIMGKVQGVVAGIDLAIKGDIIGGIQQVAAQLGPYGQVAAAAIGTGRMIASWFSGNDEEMIKKWRESVRALGKITTDFKNNLAALNREILGMDSATNQYLSSIEDFNAAWGVMKEYDTQELAQGWDAVGGKIVMVSNDFETWVMKVTEHTDHFTDRLNDLNNIMVAGTKVYQAQIQALESLIDKANGFSRTINQQMIDIERRFYTSSELVDAYSQDIEDLGKKYQESLDPQEQLEILEEIDQKIIARYEEQLKVISDAESKIKAATDAIKGLRDAADTFAKSIDESIKQIERRGFTPEQMIGATEEDIARLKGELELAVSPEEQLRILGELKQAQEALFNLQYENAETPEQQLAAQESTIAQLEWIKEQGQLAYDAQIQAHQDEIAQQQAIVDNTTDSLSVLEDLEGLQTTTNKYLNSVSTKISTLITEMQNFQKQIGVLINWLKVVIETGGYLSAADIELFERAVSATTGTVPKAQSGAGARYDTGGPVTRAGHVDPKYDAFVITHDMLNRIMRPDISFKSPAINVPAPNVTVNVPAQRGAGPNIQITGTFFPGDAGRIISEIMYDQARAGAGRAQSFNRQSYGSSRINMREN